MTKQNGFRWQKSWHGALGKGLSRRVCRDPFVEAHVYMNAHDKKTYVGNIENHGSMGAFGHWPYIGRIQFGFKTRNEARRWVEGEIPKVRRAMTKARKENAHKD